MIERNEPKDLVRGIQVAVGSILVLMGSGLLLLLGAALIGIVNEPTEMALFSLLFEESSKQGSAISGHLADLDIDIQIGEPIRTLLFLVLVVWVLSAFAGIVRGMVSTGIELLKKDS